MWDEETRFRGHTLFGWGTSNPYKGPTLTPKKGPTLTFKKNPTLTPTKKEKPDLRIKKGANLDNNKKRPDLDIKKRPDLGSSLYF